MPRWITNLYNFCFTLRATKNRYNGDKNIDWNKEGPKQSNNLSIVPQNSKHV